MSDFDNRNWVLGGGCTFDYKDGWIHWLDTFGNMIKVNFFSDDEMEDREKKDVYEEKGVDEERGLRKLIDSEEESEEEEDKKSEKAEEEEEDEKAKKEKKKDDGKCFVLYFTIYDNAKYI